MIKHESCSLDAATFRMGQWVYKGLQTREAILNFYKSEMPKFKWQLVSEDKNALQFEKPLIGKRVSLAEEADEKCAIYIYKVKGETRFTIRLKKIIRAKEEK